MNPFIPQTMQAAAIDRYGGPEVLQPHVLPVPKPGSKQVLIRLEAAGIGVWDLDVRAGEFEFGKNAETYCQHTKQDRPNKTLLDHQVLL